MATASGTPIKIGMVVPFSGLKALRENGMRIHAGTAAWINSFNAAGGLGGRPIDLIVEDSAYDIAVTAEKIRKLDEQDEVIALLNTNGTPQLTAAMPYLQARKLPLLLPFAGDERWFVPPLPGVLSVQPPFNETGYMLGRWAAREGHRRVVVFHPDYPEISVGMAGQALRGFRAHCGDGAQAEAVCVPLGSTDGAAMADAILAHDPDAIVVLVNWVELTAALADMHARGMTPPLYSWAANVTQQIADLGGDLLEGMKGLAATIVTPDAATPEAAAYRAAMARDFPDQQPDITSMTAYAQAMIFTRALETIRGDVTRDSIAAAFETLRGIESGILPPATFSPDDHMGIRHVQPMRIVGGRWHTLGAPEPFPDLHAPASAD